MSAKVKSSFLTMFLALSIVTLISALVLGSVNQLTYKKIEQVKKDKQMKAIKKVLLSGFDNNPMMEMFEKATDGGRKLECYPAKQAEEVTSVAVKTFSKMGFSGEIILMIGFLPDGKINNIEVIEQRETPGLGTKMTSSKFISQFLGKDPVKDNLKVKKDGGTVDGITAATISSRAFCDAVLRAYKSYRQ